MILEDAHVKVEMFKQGEYTLLYVTEKTSAKDAPSTAPGAFYKRGDGPWRYLRSGIIVDQWRMYEIHEALKGFKDRQDIFGLWTNERVH